MPVKNLAETAAAYRQEATRLLKTSHLLDVLGKYGEVQFGGAYAANLMLHGDVDMRVVRPEPYTPEDVFEIFRDVYFSTQPHFRSYFIHGDWDDPRAGNEFPHGRYIGLKTRIDGEKWKFDIWFMDKGESENRRREYTDIAEIPLSDEQRETILLFKQYRNEHGIPVTGQRIYELIIEEGVTDLAEFIKRIGEH